MKEIIPMCMVLLLSGLVGSGCISTALLNGKISESRSVAREFAPAEQTNGRYLGTKRIGNIEYHHYVFPEALVKHSPRELVILIPLDRFRRSLGDHNPDAILRESPPAATPGQQAVLYLDPPGFDSPYPGQDQDLRWPRGPSPNTNKALGVVVLWMASSRDERTIVIAQSAPGVSKSNESFNSFFLRSDLKYVARSPTGIGVKSLGFLGTVPADIVTSPLQAMVMAAFAIGP